MLKSILVLFFSLLLFKFSSGFPTTETSQLSTELSIEVVNPETLGGHFEGDMILNPEQLSKVENLGTRNGLNYNYREYRWPRAEVYIELDKEIDQTSANLIWTAVTNIQNATCIRFFPRTDNKNFVYVTNKNDGCYSDVGYQKKQQILNLGNGCFYVGIIMHEFIHALGFLHQQSASNRDDYVRILYDNVQNGQEHNFEKFGKDTISDYGQPYDYDSIMHYGEDYFSKNGQSTIIPLNPNAEIGQREYMTDIDIKKIKLMYNCN